MKKISLLILFIILVQTASAQSLFKGGYVVTLANDTLRGVIDLGSDKDNALLCRFKTASNDKKVTEYQPSEIISYRFDKEGKYYLSKEIKIGNKPRLVFLEFLVQGMMNLYYFKDKHQEYFFLKEQNGNITEITQKRDHFDGKRLITDSAYVNILNYTFREYPQLSENIRTERKTINFNKLDLIMLTHDYHDLACKTDEICVVYAYDYKKLYPKVSLRPYLGIQYIEDLSVFPVAGFQFTWTPFVNRFPQLSLLVDGSISGMKTKDEEAKTAGYYKHSEFSSMLTQWKVGLEFKYLKSKFQPFVQGGFASAFTFGSSSNNYITYIENGVIEKSPFNEKNIYEGSYGGWFASAGLGYKLPNKKSVFLQFSYENIENNDSKLKAMQLKAGYIF